MSLKTEYTTSYTVSYARLYSFVYYILYDIGYNVICFVFMCDFMLLTWHLIAGGLMHYRVDSKDNSVLPPKDEGKAKPLFVEKASNSTSLVSTCWINCRCFKT